MVRTVLRNVTRQLRYLHVTRQLPLETGEDDLALSCLQAVNEAWDHPLHIVTCESNELLVHEVSVAQRGL